MKKNISNLIHKYKNNRQFKIKIIAAFLALVLTITSISVYVLTKDNDKPNDNLVTNKDPNISKEDPKPETETDDKEKTDSKPVDTNNDKDKIDSKPVDTNNDKDKTYSKPADTNNDKEKTDSKPADTNNDKEKTDSKPADTNNNNNNESGSASKPKPPVNNGGESTSKPKPPADKTTYGDVEFIDEVIPFITGASIPKRTELEGTSGVGREGVNGIRRKEVRKVYVNGKYTHTETVKNTYTAKEPVEKLVWHGTMTQADYWYKKTEQEFITETFRLINVERNKAGLPSIAHGGGTMQANANTRAREILTDYSHNSASGANKGYAGENIVRGWGTPAATVAQWMGSPDHKAFILSGALTHGVIGFTKQGTPAVFIGDW